MEMERKQTRFFGGDVEQAFADGSSFDAVTGVERVQNG